MMAGVRRGLFALSLAGCGFTVGPGSSIDAAVDDVPGDATDAPLVDALSFDVNVDLCYGPMNAYRICLPAMPSSPLTLSGTIDTTACAGGFVLAIGSGSPDLCVISGTTVTASSTVRITGGRPLAVVATQDLTIESGATLDASSVAGGLRGPGSNNTTCNTGQPGGSGSGGGGGGAGGSFQSRGGAGGAGMGSTGGTSGLPVFATSLRGGCRGSTGGGASPGPGGDSGGAIYLVAGGRLQVDGRINASGAGGRGAGSKSGGGGGGSGGMIALHGGTIAIASGARLWANGGGGGGGGTSNAGGSNGGQSTDPATGGPSGAGDGDGGVGAVQINSGGPGTSGGKGGGGGGGGVGVIENLTGGNLSPGTFSPPAS